MSHDDLIVAEWKPYDGFLGAGWHRVEIHPRSVVAHELGKADEWSDRFGNRYRRVKAGA